MSDPKKTPIRLGKTFTIGDQEVVILNEMAVEQLAPGLTQVTVKIVSENFDINFEDLRGCVIHAPEDIITAGQEDARAALLETEGHWSLTRLSTEWRVEFRDPSKPESGWMRDSRIYYVFAMAELSAEQIHERHGHDTRIIPRYFMEGDPDDR